MIRRCSGNLEKCIWFHQNTMIGHDCSESLCGRSSVCMWAGHCLCGRSSGCVWAEPSIWRCLVIRLICPTILSQKLTIFPVLWVRFSSTHSLAVFTHARGSSRLRNQINLIRSIGEWRAEQKHRSHSFVSDIPAKFMLWTPFLTPLGSLSLELDTSFGSKIRHLSP